VLIEKEKAVGIELSAGRTSPEKIMCRKEVIVSAGSIKSPQLLMLSGIGEASSLKRAGIE
jgi:choline dehydrogenase